MNIHNLVEEFLLESKLKDILDKYHSISDEVKQHYIKQIPENNTQHLDWVLNQYNKGNISGHDINGILTTFNRNKKHLDKKQINQYKSINELQQAITPFIGNNESIKDKAAKGTETVYTSPTMIIKRHHNYESCLKGAILPDSNKNKEKTKHGAKSQWCVSAGGENGIKEHSHYTINSLLPVYTIDHIHPDGKTERHMVVTDPFKTQFDTELRNEMNNRPGFDNFEDSSPTLLDDYIKKYPELNKTPLKEFFNNESRDNMQDEYVKKAIDTDDKGLLSRFAGNESLTTKHITSIIDHAISHKKTNPYLLHTVSRNKQLNDNHKTSIINHCIESNNDNVLRTFVLSQPKINSESISRITNYGIEKGNKNLLNDILHRKINFRRSHNITPDLENNINLALK